MTGTLRVADAAAAIAKGVGSARSVEIGEAGPEHLPSLVGESILAAVTRVVRIPGYAGASTAVLSPLTLASACHSNVLDQSRVAAPSSSPPKTSPSTISIFAARFVRAGAPRRAARSGGR